MDQKRTASYRVVLDDLDFMGHVNHAKWITVCERIRTGLVAEEFTKLLESGIGLVVAEVNIKYKTAAAFNEILDFELSFFEKNPKAFTVKHIAKNSEGRVCIEADVLLVGVDKRGKPVDIPPFFLESLLR